VFLAVACDVRDISLGQDPGRGSEPVGGNSAVDRDADMEEDAVILVATGGAGGIDAARYDGKNGWDRHDDRYYKDAEKEDEEIRRDSGPREEEFDASVQPVNCGYSTCRRGHVCCESCQSCTLLDEDCPLDCELPQPSPVPCRQCEPDKITMYCPPGTMGGPMCIRMDDGSCAWQPAPCNPTNMPCGESVGDNCQAWEYCGAPDCGKGDNTGYCWIRPSERACLREQEEPVCGCDGKDYYNECFAQAAGTNVAYDGPCR